MTPEIEYFALRMASGHTLESPEDLQFYANNKVEIEKALAIVAEKQKALNVGFMRHFKDLK
jgi:hypothetical protein